MTVMLTYTSSNGIRFNVSHYNFIWFLSITKTILICLCYLPWRRTQSFCENDATRMVKKLQLIEKIQGAFMNVACSFVRDFQEVWVDSCEKTSYNTKVFLEASFNFAKKHFFVLNFNRLRIRCKIASFRRRTMNKHSLNICIVYMTKLQAENQYLKS